MALFEEFLRPSGEKRDTLAGRTSLDAFDRQISEKGTKEPAPAGAELEMKQTSPN